MNLNFVFVKTVEQNGRLYRLEKANVTFSRDFWRNWRYAQCQAESARSLGCDEPENSLCSLVTLRKEEINKESYWFAYRMVPIADTSPPARFPLSYSVRDTTKLLPYQPKALAYICNAIVSHGAAADGSDTGTGKTYVAIATARDLHYQPAIVCKKAGIATWKKVCGFFDLTPLFIVNWEHAKTDTFRYIKKERHSHSGEYWFKWELPAGTLLIFDEAHVANHTDSQNSALYMASKGIPSISCSATFADKPTRLRPLLHVLGVVPHDKFDAWASGRLQQFDDQHGNRECVDDLEAMRGLNKILYPSHGFRLSYEDPDVKRHFPDVVYQTLVVSLGREHEKNINVMYREMLVKVAKYREMGKQAEVLVADLRYRQAAELHKADVLVELAQTYIQQGMSVCMFVNFRETLAYLAKRLHTNSMIYGDQDVGRGDGPTREQVIEAFQSNKSNLVLCMADAGGQSISLHDLEGGHRRISLICPTYDSIKLKQILGRTHRAGSKSTPIIKLVYAAGTVEERVAETVNRKLDNIAALNDGDLMEPDLFQLSDKR